MLTRPSGLGRSCAATMPVTWVSEKPSLAAFSRSTTISSTRSSASKVLVTPEVFATPSISAEMRSTASCRSSLSLDATSMSMVSDEPKPAPEEIDRSASCGTSSLRISDLMASTSNPSSTWTVIEMPEAAEPNATRPSAAEPTVDCTTLTPSTLRIFCSNSSEALS